MKINEQRLPSILREVMEDVTFITSQMVNAENPASSQSIVKRKERK